MSRYEKCYQRLDERNEAAFVPFTVLGDPNLEKSLAAISTLAESGADALELGFPFSDPLADGPTIQAAMDRALAAKVTPRDCLDLIKQFRTTNDQIPIGLLVYANIVYAFGLDKFYSECAQAGVDSVLVADVPVQESGDFCKAARVHSIDPVLLCPPNIDESALQKVATDGAGYTYLLSRAGVTGTNVAAGAPIEQLLRELDRLNAARPILGFGISTPDHVAGAIAAGAKGVIVGSAIVRIIQKHADDQRALCENLSKFVAEMKAATRRS